MPLRTIKGAGFSEDILIFLRKLTLRSQRPQRRDCHSPFAFRRDLRVRHPRPVNRHAQSAVTHRRYRRTRELHFPENQISNEEPENKGSPSYV